MPKPKPIQGMTVDPKTTISGWIMPLSVFLLVLILCFVCDTVQSFFLAQDFLSRTFHPRKYLDPPLLETQVLCQRNPPWQLDSFLLLAASSRHAKPHLRVNLDILFWVDRNGAGDDYFFQTVAITREKLTSGPRVTVCGLARNVRVTFKTVSFIVTEDTLSEGQIIRFMCEESTS